MADKGPLRTLSYVSLHTLELPSVTATRTLLFTTPFLHSPPPSPSPSRLYSLYIRGLNHPGKARTPSITAPRPPSPFHTRVVPLATSGREILQLTVGAASPPGRETEEMIGECASVFLIMGCGEGEEQGKKLLLLPPQPIMFLLPSSFLPSF